MPDMDTPERRDQQRTYYLRMREDPAKVENYRKRKREWARQAAAARRAGKTFPAREA
jgi:hypothetical protein